jgi:hypothetical protein
VSSNIGIARVAMLAPPQAGASGQAGPRASAGHRADSNAPRATFPLTRKPPRKRGIFRAQPCCPLEIRTHRWRKPDSNLRSRLVEGPSRNCAIRPRGVARRAATQQGPSIWTAMLPVRGKSSENVGVRDFYWIAAVTHRRRAREARFAQSPLCLPNETDSLTSRTAPINSDAKSLQAAPFEPDRLSPAAEILDNARRGCRHG